MVTPGQAHDGRALEFVLSDIRVPRVGVGRPRTRPEVVLGYKAYSSRATRAMLRRRGITAVIPEPSDQQAHRKRRGARGGRPPSFDRETYKQRNLVERSFNLLKQWRGLATRYDKHATIYRAGAVLQIAAVLSEDEIGRVRRSGGRIHAPAGTSVISASCSRNARSRSMNRSSTVR